MVEQPPQKRVKRSSILNFFQRKPPSDGESLTRNDSELLPAAEEKEDSLCASDIECQLLPNATPPELSPGSTSAFGESTTSTPPEPGPGSTSAFGKPTTATLPELSPGSTSAFGESTTATPLEPEPESTSAFCESTTTTPPEPGPGSTSASTHTVSESSLLPLVGPYDLEAINTSLLRGTLSDGDKYNVLNQLDRPQQYNFPAVV